MTLSLLSLKQQTVCLKQTGYKGQSNHLPIRFSLGKNYRRLRFTINPGDVTINHRQMSAKSGDTDDMIRFECDELLCVAAGSSFCPVRDMI